jgi:hypothetical protein
VVAVARLAAFHDDEALKPWIVVSNPFYAANAEAG